VERLAPLVPTEVASVGTLDPDTGLMTHAVSVGAPAGYLAGFLDRAYLRGEAESVIDQARSGRVVSTTPTDLMREFLRVEGLDREMRVIFSAAGSWWGLFCGVREGTSPPFGDHEVRFLRRVAPHAAHGLRMATLVDMAAVADGEGQGGAGPTPATPGVLVVDDRGRVLHRTAAAASYLGDLADVPPTAPPLPVAVASALAQLRAAARQESGDVGSPPATSALRARGHSGRWYTLTAARSEPDAAGESASVVVLTPVARTDVAPILARLYGLSRREREVLTFVARGESTKEIAARLGISPYTVQDHLDHAFDKVGVRGRRAVLARLFLDGTSA
jgi:DNA-binding CsgD family transcriptional regulator